MKFVNTYVIILGKIMKEVRQELENWKKEQGFSNDKELADLLDIKENNISMWVSRGSIPEKHILKYESIKNTSQKLPAETKTLRYFEDVYASAGYGAENSNENFTLVNIDVDFMKILGIPIGDFDLIKVFGDSMEPFARNGDFVIVDRKIQPKNNDVVIANIDGDIYIKKFFKNPIKKEIKLTSLNNFYQDIVLSKVEADHLIIVGIVLCSFTLNFNFFNFNSNLK